jgi:hypothetical protein
VLLGLALIVVALLWARRLHRTTDSGSGTLLGPWVMGLCGVAVFLFYLWLITYGAGQLP